MALPDEFSVLVLDMAHFMDPANERTVAGFPSEVAAEAYAIARVRDSIEELRRPGIDPAELKRLWSSFGEGCMVVGGSYRSADHIDSYLATPATAKERNWTALAPGPRRFYARVLISNASDESVWAGGFFEATARPTGQALLARFSEQAQEAFARNQIAPTEPWSIHVAGLHELPLPPQPAAEDIRALRNWKVAVDFVCHDIKFGYSATGIFQWPGQPNDPDLDTMARLLVADALAVRGDGPAYLEFTDLLSKTVEETTEQPDYPLP